MAKQESLFGPRRPQASSQTSRALTRNEIPGFLQPFEVPVSWEIDYSGLLVRPNVRYCHPKIVQGPANPCKGRFRSATYCFVSPVESKGLDGVASACKNSIYRLAWVDEAISLTIQYPTFPSRQLIWVLGGKFVVGSTHMYLVMRYDEGWELNLSIPSLGEIIPQHLVLVHVKQK